VPSPFPNVKKILGEHVVLDSTPNRHEAQWCKQPGKNFAAHEAMNHGDGEYVRGDATTETVEGFFRIFKTRYDRRLPALRRAAFAGLFERVRFSLLEPRQTRLR
jgi:hypothetical protein